MENRIMKNEKQIKKPLCIAGTWPMAPIWLRSADTRCPFGTLPE